LLEGAAGLGLLLLPPEPHCQTLPSITAKAVKLPEAPLPSGLLPLLLLLLLLLLGLLKRELQGATARAEMQLPLRGAGRAQSTGLLLPQAPCTLPLASSMAAATAAQC
jgi:hypothetical protein